MPNILMSQYKINSGITVSSKDTFPKEPYFAIITFSSHSYEENYGNHDGRMDSCTINSVNFVWWPKDYKEYWLDRIKQLMCGYYKKDFIALEDGKIVEPSLSVNI